jgi:hypothetical protein
MQPFARLAMVQMAIQARQRILSSLASILNTSLSN